MYEPKHEMMLGYAHTETMSEDSTKYPGYKTNFAGWYLQLHLIHKSNFDIGALQYLLPYITRRHLLWHDNFLSGFPENKSECGRKQAGETNLAKVTMRLGFE
jgi:hypothetical protein